MQSNKKPSKTESPDVQANGQAMDTGHTEAAQPGTVPIGGSPLKSRIDPAAIVVDWDTEGVADEDDKGPAAKWSRPPKDNFVRAHPDWATGVYLLDCRSSSGFEAEYVLSKEVAAQLIEEDEPVTAARVFLLATRDGGLLFWPVRLGDPTEQQRPTDHITTALAAVEEARHKWVKIAWRWRKTINGWRTRAARIDIPDPAWPEDPLALFLETVSDRFINDPNDQVILRYLGKA
jgi:hypothetical protein